MRTLNGLLMLNVNVIEINDFYWQGSLSLKDNENAFEKAGSP